MYVKRNDSFFYTCKEAFFLGINPLSPANQNSEAYRSLVALFNAIPEDKRFDLFLHYLGEEKYCCDLWAASLILRFSNPEPEVERKCREVLGRTSSVAD